MLAGSITFNDSDDGRDSVRSKIRRVRASDTK